MADITISRGDFGFALTFTVQTATGGVFDLTSKTVTFNVWNPANRAQVVLAGTCTTSATASTGVARYYVTSTDFPAKGLYSCEIEATESGKKDSTKVYSLEVTESP